jgi:hypothetical protein
VCEKFRALTAADSTQALSNCQALLGSPNQYGGAKQMGLNEWLRNLEPADGLKVWLSVPWFS